MLLTRATDNRLKTFFTSGEVRFRESPFQGKGFRSLGQEAIYAAGIRLRRGEQYRTADGWTGDVVAPIIRDLGAALAMRPSPETVRMVLSAQMAKAGPPMDGKDLHVGDFGWGILPASAPLAIGTLTLAGMALAFQREGSGRVAISFIGEGGSSLGEWHEAINLCAARKLPAVFCLENNQTALSTPVREQSAVRVFADKAAGYGIPGITIDGTDADEIAAAFAWAVERARAGLGPALIELVAMRMCGHAHHDDMLYLGRDTPPSWEYPRPADSGYADREAYAYWSGVRSDRPIRRTAAGRRRHPRRRAGPMEDGDRRAGRARGPGGDRRGLARRVACRRRRCRGRAAARARRGARSGVAAIRRPGSGAAGSRSRACRSIATARPFSKASLRASATRWPPIRASSSSARTSAARTATRSCCCGRCSKSSAIA